MQFDELLISSQSTKHKSIWMCIINFHLYRFTIQKRHLCRHTANDIIFPLTFATLLDDNTHNSGNIASFTCSWFVFNTEIVYKHKNISQCKYFTQNFSFLLFFFLQQDADRGSNFLFIYLAFKRILKRCLRR